MKPVDILRMHVLASDYRSEFLSCPQLVRFELGRGRDGFEPTLLIKASTLLLKYIVSGVPLRLLLAKVADRLLYAVQVGDDKNKPAGIWSILENERERDALAGLARGEKCQVFLFNELALNVAWVEAELSGQILAAPHLLASLEFGRIDQHRFAEHASALLGKLHLGEALGVDGLTADIQVSQEWSSVHNTLVTNSATDSPVNLFDKNEGSQQEELIIWLADNLHPNGATRSPQIPKGKGTRELIDAVLSHEFGTIIFESKTLAIFSRNNLPDRVKLSRDVSGHLCKATAQLQGAIRNLKTGIRVTNLEGEVLDIERNQPIHAVILVPDLELVEIGQRAEMIMLFEFMQETRGLLHILDPAELLRMVQAAEMISARSKTTTPMMAFDYYLMERAKKSIELKRLCFSMLLRFEGDAS